MNLVDRSKYVLVLPLSQFNDWNMLTMTTKNGNELN